MSTPVASRATRGQTMRAVVWMGCVAAVWVGAAAVGVVWAHPTSTTSVVISTPRPGEIAVVMRIDAQALLAKIDATSGGPLEAETSDKDVLAARLTARAAALGDRVFLRLDHERIRLDLAPVTVDEAGQAALRWSAAWTAGAREATWATPLVQGAYPVAWRAAGTSERVQWVQGGDESAPMPLGVVASTTWRALTRVVALGFTHILPNGIDHILFVVGLVLLARRPGAIFAQVSAFTVAHSVTLGLALYGAVSLPPAVVEPLIALSVAYVGLENLVARRLTAWRIGIVFAFGLLHGLGFAGALAELDLSQTNLLATLVSFNVGVELGQLTVVALAWAALRVTGPVWQRPIGRLASAVVGVAGLVWTIERMLA